MPQLKLILDTEWLSRDPKTGALIGPDGGQYVNGHQAAYYALLKLCACGSPDDAFNFCRDAVSCFDRRGCNDDPPTRDWINAENALKELIQERPWDAAHVLAHLFNHIELLEHGGNVGGSWLTDKGEIIVDLGPVTQDILDGESQNEQSE